MRTCSAGRSVGAWAGRGAPAGPGQPQPSPYLPMASASAPTVLAHMLPPTGRPPGPPAPASLGGVVPGGLSAPPTLGALCPPGCSPDWTASAVRSLGTGCMAPGWAGHWDPGMKLLPRGCPWRCPRLGSSTAEGCGLAVRGLEVRDLRGSSQDRTGRLVRVSSASGGGGRPLVWGSLLRLYEACACLRPDSTLWK